MARTSVSLNDKATEQVQALAERCDCTVAEAVRRGLDLLDWATSLEPGERIYAGKDDHIYEMRFSWNLSPQAQALLKRVAADVDPDIAKPSLYRRLRNQG